MMAIFHVGKWDTISYHCFRCLKMRHMVIPFLSTHSMDHIYERSLKEHHKLGRDNKTNCIITSKGFRCSLLASKSTKFQLSKERYRNESKVLNLPAAVLAGPLDTLLVAAVGAPDFGDAVPLAEAALQNIKSIMICLRYV